MNLDLNIFNLKLQLTETKKGIVLISEPFSQDTYFHRSVIFITEHDQTGTIGFILNKSLPMKIDEVLKGFPEIPAKIGLGGPVKTNTVHYIHTLGEKVPDSVHVYDDIYWGGDFKTIKKLALNGVSNPDNTRFFVGYSGWSAKQLENEISNNFWIVTNIDSNLLFKYSQNFWEEILYDLGTNYKIWLNAPQNPALN